MLLILNPMFHRPICSILGHQEQIGKTARHTKNPRSNTILDLANVKQQWLLRKD